MIPSATGESRKQSGLMNQQTAMKEAAGRTTSNIAIGLATSLWRAARGGGRFSIFPIGQAIKRHRRGPGEDHRQQNQQGKRPVRKTVGSHQHRSNRKWKGEDSVRKADELKN